MSSLWGRLWEDLRYTYSAEAEAKTGDGLRSRMAPLSQFFGVIGLLMLAAIIVNREGWPLVPGCLLAIAGGCTSVMVTKHVHHVPTLRTYSRLSSLLILAGALAWFVAAQFVD